MDEYSCLISPKAFLGFNVAVKFNNFEVTGIWGKALKKPRALLKISLCKPAKLAFQQEVIRAINQLLKFIFSLLQQSALLSGL